MALLKIDMQANGSAKDFVKYSKQILLSVTIVLVSLFERKTVNEILSAIWYHLYNLKNPKNTNGGVLLLVKLQA